MKYVLVIVCTLAGVCIGVLGMRYGAQDDSPGFVFLSLFLTLMVVSMGAQSVRQLRRSDSKPATSERHFPMR